MIRWKNKSLAAVVAGLFAASAFFAAPAPAAATYSNQTKKENKEVEPKVKETAAATAASLQAALARTLLASRCLAHFSLTIVQKNDHITIEASNKISGNTDASFVEGALTSTRRIDGVGENIAIPYYITRSGKELSLWRQSPESGEWAESSPDFSKNFFGDGFGLYEILGSKGKVKLLNDAKNARTISVEAAPEPFADFFANIVGFINNRSVALDEKTRKKLRPAWLTIHIDKAAGRITDANIDVTDMMETLLAAIPAAKTDSEIQKKFRKMLDKGVVNLHISVSQYDQPQTLKPLPPALAATDAAALAGK